jgi:hypothetical protein
MAIPKTGEIVLVWRGALVASHYPVPKEEQDDPTRWVEAKVLEGPRYPPKRGERPSLYLGPTTIPFSPFWVPPAGWKTKA